jgi:hypothetical protein
MIPLDSLVFIGSCSLVCLLPLSLYFLFLTYLNQRTHPTMMSGTWDFASVLLGLGGFLLLLGPLLLSIVDSTWRGIWISGGFSEVRVILKKEGIFWSLLATFYVAVLISGIYLLIRSRRDTTVIYNLPSSYLDEAFIESLERLNRVWRKVANRFEIGMLRNADSEKEPSNRNSESISVIEVDSFPSMRNASLKWREDDLQIREQVELDFRRTLERMDVGANPVGGWFLTASVTIFVIMLMWMLFLIYLVVTPPR